MSASSVEVKTFEIDPISNTVLASSARPGRVPADPALTMVRFPAGSIRPTTMPSPGWSPTRGSSIDSICATDKAAGVSTWALVAGTCPLSTSNTTTVDATRKSDRML